MTPETLDTTTLSDPIKTSILGIVDLGSLEFTANYTKADYVRLKALEEQNLYFAVWFGGTGTDSDGRATPDGSDGKFTFQGELKVYPTGGGVNEVVGMKINVAASTPIAYEA